MNNTNTYNAPDGSTIMTREDFDSVVAHLSAKCLVRETERKLGESRFRRLSTERKLAAVRHTANAS